MKTMDLVIMIAAWTSAIVIMGSLFAFFILMFGGPTW